MRTLRERIDSILYERTALSKRPDALIRQEKPELRTQGNVTPALVLKDLCVLDFLALTKESSSAIWKGPTLRELEAFPLALGTGRFWPAFE